MYRKIYEERGGVRFFYLDKKSRVCLKVKGERGLGGLVQRLAALLPK